MKVGILYEGDLDEEPLKVIVQRVAERINPLLKHINFVLKPTHGSIDTHIRMACIFFFDTNDCSMAIFVADTDGRYDKPRRIKALVSRHCKHISPGSKNVVACPEPELEQWFLDEEIAIKRIFSLSADEELPYKTMDSKERLRRIIDENNKNVTITVSEIYTEIAETMDLGKLIMGSKSFNSFYSSMERVL